MNIKRLKSGRNAHVKIKRLYEEMDRFNTRSGLQPNKIKRKEHKAMQLNRQLPRLVPIKDYCTCCIKPVVSIKQEKEEAAKISSS